MRRILLSQAFLDWAAPKLSSLAMARRHDALADLPGPQWYFIGVLDGIMSEYENLPFAQATYPGNLDTHGNVRYTKKQLRKLALAYLRSHSFPDRGARHSGDPAVPPVPVNIAPPPSSVTAVTAISLAPVTAVAPDVATGEGHHATATAVNG